MRVLITGGAGFIGSHLAERCLAEGWDVTVVDDLSGGSLKNVAHLEGRPGFSMTVGSALDEPLLEKAEDVYAVIFHLAATVGVRRILEKPILAMDNNIGATDAVLKIARRMRAHVVLASSSEVYGPSEEIPLREDAPRLGSTNCARWSYGCCKALNEHRGFAYWQQHGIPFTAVRLFNVVGARQGDRYDMVLPTFLKQALSGAPITVFGSGEQRRCFTYVGDVVEVLIRVALNPATYGETLNAGADAEISINEVAGLVKAFTGSNSEIVHIPFESAFGAGFEETARRVPCLIKIQRLLGWRPSTPLETVIRMLAVHQTERHARGITVPRF